MWVIKDGLEASGLCLCLVQDSIFRPKTGKTGPGSTHLTH